MGLQQLVEIDFGFAITLFPNQCSRQIQLNIVGLGVALDKGLQEFDGLGRGVLPENLCLQKGCGFPVGAQLQRSLDFCL